MRHSGGYSRQQGLGMIEILITLLVLIAGVLGAASLHLSALRENQHINQRLQAITLAEDIRGRLLADRGNSDSYLFDSSTPKNAEQTSWASRVQGSLPQGRIIVLEKTTDPKVYAIQILWNETHSANATKTDCDPTTDDPEQLTCFQLVVQL